MIGTLYYREDVKRPLFADMSRERSLFTNIGKKVVIFYNDVKPKKIARKITRFSSFNHKVQGIGGLEEG